MPDVIQQVPPALFQATTFAPTIIVDATIEITDIVPRNLVTGQRGKALLRNFERKGGVVIDGVEQEIVTSPDLTTADFIAAVDHVSDLGDYTVTVASPPGVVTQTNLQWGAFDGTWVGDSYDIGAGTQYSYAFAGVDPAFKDLLTPILGNGAGAPDFPSSRTKQQNTLNTMYTTGLDLADISGLTGRRYNWYDRDTTMYYVGRFSYLNDTEGYMRKWAIAYDSSGNTLWEFGFFITDMKPRMRVWFGTGANDYNDYISSVVMYHVLSAQSQYGIYLKDFTDPRSWNAVHFGYDNTNNKLYIGVNGAQDEFTLGSTSAADVDRFIWSTGKTDGQEEAVYGYFYQWFWVDALIFGTDGLYVDLDDRIISTWTYLSQYPEQGAGGTACAVGDGVDGADSMRVYAASYSNSSTLSQTNFNFWWDMRPRVGTLVKTTDTYPAKKAWGTAGAGSFNDCNFIAGREGTSAAAVSSFHLQWNGSSWSTSTAISVSREEHCACGGSTGNTMIVGGSNATPADLDSTEEWDGTSWTAGGILSAAARGLGIAGTPDDALLLGASATQRYSGTAWSAETAPPTSRYFSGGWGVATAATFSGGGAQYISTVDSPDTYEWNDTSWTSKPRKPQSGGSSSVSGCTTNCGYAPGQQSSNGFSERILFRYWSPDYPMLSYPTDT